jgi:hypothetical protein
MTMQGKVLKADLPGVGTNPGAVFADLEQQQIHLAQIKVACFIKW